MLLSLCMFVFCIFALYNFLLSSFLLQLLHNNVPLGCRKPSFDRLFICQLLYFINTFIFLAYKISGNSEKMPIVTF